MSGCVCTILKLTRLCNLRCTYCRDWRSGSQATMPYRVQLHSFQKLFGCEGYRNIQVVWHGGEPLLMGQPAFLKILALQNLFRRPGQNVRNSIQSNATLIDEEWLALFTRHHIEVSVSIDGPAVVHDRTRRYASGKGSFGETLRGLRLLREANLLSGVLLVVTESLRSLGPRAILDFLRSESITNVDLLPAWPVSAPDAGTDSFVRPDLYIEFLLGLLKVRQEFPTPWVRIRTLDSAIEAVQGLPPRYCELAGNCEGYVFSIEPDGDVYPCDKCAGDPTFRLGNIITDGFESLRQAALRQRTVRQETRPFRQPACAHFKYCHGWCPHDRLILGRQGDDASGCCGLGQLFQGIIDEHPSPGGSRGTCPPAMVAEI